MAMDSFQQSFPSSIMQCWLCHTSSRPNFVTPSDWARKNDELSITIFSCVPVQYSLLERMLFIDYSNSNDVIDCWSSRSLFNSDIHCFSSDLKLKKKKDPCMETQMWLTQKFNWVKQLPSIVFYVHPKHFHTQKLSVTWISMVLPEGLLVIFIS